MRLLGHNIHLFYFQLQGLNLLVFDRNDCAKVLSKTFTGLENPTKFLGYEVNRIILSFRNFFKN